MSIYNQLERLERLDLYFLVYHQLSRIQTQEFIATEGVMGNKNGNLVDQQIKEVLAQYEILQEVPSQSLTYLEHRKTGKEYLLREMTFNDKNQFNRAFESLKKKKVELQGCEHVVSLVKYMTKTEDQFCSTFYKIYALFQYPQRTLDDEISQRNLQKRRFQQKELWSILASCILGLSHLQKQGIRHTSLRSSNILLSHQGIIKIADPYTTAALSNYDTLLNKRSTPHIYLSPEQADSIQNQMITSPCNPYKADIWSLGIIMLEAGLLQYQDECYRDEGSRIHWETLNYNINRFGQSYSQQLRSMIEFMLSKDERTRPQWIQLEGHVMKVDEGVRGSYAGAVNQQTDRYSKNSTNPYQPANIYQTNTQEMNRQFQTPRITQPFQTTRQSTINNVNVTGTFNTGQPDYHRLSAHKVSNEVKIDTPMVNSNYPINYSGSKNSTSNINNGRIIVPVKISNIQATRPTRNIFPANVYIEHTKIDENLVVVEDDDNQTGTGLEIGNKHSQTKGAFTHDQLVQARNPHETYQNRNQNQDQRHMADTTAKEFKSDSKQNNSISNGNNNGTRNYSYQTGTSFNHSENNTRSRQNSSHQQGQNRTNMNSDVPGQPEYKVEIFKMGSKYEGYKLNGMRHGQGKFHYQDGGMYDGEWNCNRMEGFGKLHYQSGKLAYQGQWVRDQFTGYGVLYNQQPDQLTKSFNYKNFDDIEQYWTKYQGNFFEDNKHGKGTLYLSNGEYFEGEFNNDIVHGKGVYHTMNGKTISAVWNNNRILP